MTHLTRRQKRVVDLLMSGLSIRETARVLGVGEVSVKNTVYRAETRLGVRIPRPGRGWATVPCGHGGRKGTCLICARRRTWAYVTVEGLCESEAA